MVATDTQAEKFVARTLAEPHACCYARHHVCHTTNNCQYSKANVVHERMAPSAGCCECPSGRVFYEAIISTRTTQFASD